jgi:hypothetical protein
MGLKSLFLVDFGRKIFIACGLAVPSSLKLRKNCCNGGVQIPFAGAPNVGAEVEFSCVLIVQPVSSLGGSVPILAGSRAVGWWKLARS